MPIAAFGRRSFSSAAKVIMITARKPTLPSAPFFSFFSFQGS